MSVKEDFEDLLNKLQTQRDEINLKLHLASMEAKQEFEEAEQEWQQLKGCRYSGRVGGDVGRLYY